MVKIGILDIDREGSMLNILGAKGKCDCHRSKCERLSLLIPEVANTIPEIMLVAMLNIDIRQRPIETCMTKVHPVFQVLSIAYGLEDTRLYLLESNFDIMISGNKRDVPSWLGDEALECFKERAMDSDNFF